MGRRRRGQAGGNVTAGVRWAGHGRPADAGERADAGWGRGRRERLWLFANRRGGLSCPVGLLNVAGYYDGLLGFLDRAVQEGFLTPDCRDLLMVETDFGKLLARLAGTFV
ncbi:LOG family protein [Chloracidobacterium aggregatum]|uniref:LOG family protein n=1 Tax=Chloracidobacterium aggregatum TaxID=2851959 RepID=UPI002017EC75|nr:LOG family protein [Chloracidobacterium aggregatum]